MQWDSANYVQRPEERAVNKVGSRNRPVDGRVCELVETLLKYYRSLRVEHFSSTRVERTIHFIYIYISTCVYIRRVCLLDMGVGKSARPVGSCYTSKILESVDELFGLQICFSRGPCSLHALQNHKAIFPKEFHQPGSESVSAQIDQGYLLNSLAKAVLC